MACGVSDAQPRCGSNVQYEGLGRFHTDIFNRRVLRPAHRCRSLVPLKRAVYTALKDPLR